MIPEERLQSWEKAFDWSSNFMQALEEILPEGKSRESILDQVSHINTAIGAQLQEAESEVRANREFGF